MLYATPHMNRLALLIATGFGSGWLRPAPGTWGSLVGFGYFFLLLKVPPALAASIAVAVIALAVWSAGSAAEQLGRKDPGQVVIDEICAVPLAAWPLAQLASAPWWLWLAAFALWRIADIVKPAPARQLEALPGGWGIVADDLMSAVYAGAVLWIAMRIA